MSSITAANAIITLTLPGVFNSPVQIQGFSADDVFDTEEIEPTEFQMGVDGNLTGGLIFVATPWNITLMADSASNDFFEQWISAQRAAGDLYWANGSVTLPSIGKSYAMTRGGLQKYPSMAGAKKTLQPRKYTVLWAKVSPARI